MCACVCVCCAGGWWPSALLDSFEGLGLRASRQRDQLQVGLCCKPHHLSDVVATAGVLLQCDSCNNICIKHHSLELAGYCQPHLADVPCSSKEEQQIATVNITTNLGNMFTHWDSSNSNIAY